MSKISFRSRRLDSFINGLVWALYFALWIVLIAFFCNFSNRSDRNPHARIEKWKCGKTSELYISTNVVLSSWYFNLDITSIHLAILFAILLTCSFHVKLSEIVRPRKSNCLTLSIGTLFSRRFKTGSDSSGQSMELKTIYFVLVAF